MRVLAGAKQRLRPLAFSPDGRHLAAGAEYQTRGDRIVQVWDLTGDAAPAWAGLPDPPNSPAGSENNRVGFEPDGRHLLVASLGHVQRVAVGTWQVEDDPFFEGVWPESFAADGRAFVSRPSWNGRSWVFRFARHGPGGWGQGWRVEVLNDERQDWHGPPKFLLDAAGTRAVRVQPRRAEPARPVELCLQSFDGETGRALGQWVGELPSYAVRWVTGPGGLLVQLVARTLYAVYLDRPGSKPVKRSNDSTKHFTDAAFSPDGRWLATTSNDALVTIWDTATWQPARQYRWGIGRLRSVAFSPDGTLCAAGSDTGRVVVWDFDG